MSGNVLDVIIYHESEFNENVYKGVLKGLDAYFATNKNAYEFKLQEIEKSPYAIYKNYKIDADATVYKMLKSIFGEKNMWKILLTQSYMFMEKDGETCGLTGLFNDVSNIGRYDLASCAITDYSIIGGSAEMKYAQGLIIAYHEANHHKNLVK